MATGARRDQSGQVNTRTVGVVLAFVAILVLLLGTIGLWSGDDGGDGDADTTTTPVATSAALTLSGSVRLGVRQTTATVALAADATDDSAVQATVQALDKGTTPSVRVAGPNVDTDQFRLVLSQPAPKGGVTVEWEAAGLVDPEDAPADDPGLGDEWVAVLVVTGVAIIAAFGAYGLALRRCNPSTDGSSGDRGLELTAFLKVAALLAISALAVIVVLLATDEDAQNLAALFTLFGTIAGYLAGTRPSTEEELGDSPVGGGGGGTLNAAGQPPAPPGPAPRRPRLRRTGL
jgi:hypothetical protein